MSKPAGSRSSTDSAGVARRSPCACRSAIVMRTRTCSAGGGTHLTVDQSTSPDVCLQISWYIDEDERIVVVGHAGRHPPPADAHRASACRSVVDGSARKGLRPGRRPRLGGPVPDWQWRPDWLTAVLQPRNLVRLPPRARNQSGASLEGSPLFAYVANQSDQRPVSGQGDGQDHWGPAVRTVRRSRR